MKPIERALRQAVTDSMPDMDEALDHILNAAITPMSTQDFIVKQQPPKRNRTSIDQLKNGLHSLSLQPAILFSLCLLLIVTICGGVVFNTTYVRADTLVAIDVNPSIELTTNKKNKVISVKAKNKDADIILEDMELRRVDLNIAVNAIIGSMLKHGYLQDDENTILISVSNKKEEKAKQIQNNIEEDFRSSLKVVDKQATFIKQKVTKDNSLEKLANKLNISIGKLQFINQILELDDTLDITSLANMTMNELAALAQQYEILPEETITTTTPVKKQEKDKSETDYKTNKTEIDSSIEQDNNHTTEDPKNNKDNPDASDYPGILYDDAEDNDEEGYKNENDDEEDYENDEEEDYGNENDDDWEEYEIDDPPSDSIDSDAPGKLDSSKPTEGSEEE